MPKFPSETPPTPTPVQDAVQAAKDHADALAAQAALDGEKALQETLASIGAPAEYAKAGQTIEGLVAWRPQIDTALARTAIPPKTRSTLLMHRPGLALAFDKVDGCTNELTDVGIAHVESLRRYRTAYEKLSADDLEPKTHLGEAWVFAPVGERMVNSKVWKLRCNLGNSRPVDDVGVIINKLDLAFEELTERLGGPIATAAPRPTRPPVRERPPEDAPAEPVNQHFNPLDYPKR